MMQLELLLHIMSSKKYQLKNWKNLEKKHIIYDVKSVLKSDKIDGKL